MIISSIACKKKKYDVFEFSKRQRKVFQADVIGSENNRAVIVIITKEGSIKGIGDVWLKGKGCIPDLLPNKRVINPKAKFIFEERKKTHPIKITDMAYT